MKVLFLATIPSPYRVHFFNELGKHCDLTVLFEKKFSSERSEEWKTYNIVNFKAIFLKGCSVKANKAFCPEVIRIYKKTPHDVLIIGGYNTPTAMYLISYLRRHKVRFILSADGAEIKQESRIAYLVKRHFISAASMWIGTSQGTKDYFCHYGATDHKVRRYPFTSMYQNQMLKTPLTKQEKAEIRMALNMEHKYTVISVGQFIYRKGFDTLLHAACKLSQDIEFYLIGGEPTEEYLRIVQEGQLSNVHFLPFMNSQKLGEYYKASDLFVLPTREDIWGLVINEAASYALPMITTNQCVAGVEFINQYRNGILIEKDNVDGLADAITAIRNDSDMEKRMALNSLKAAEMYTFENMAAVHMDILREFLLQKE